MLRATIIVQQVLIRVLAPECQKIKYGENRLSDSLLDRTLLALRSAKYLLGVRIVSKELVKNVLKGD